MTNEMLIESFLTTRAHSVALTSTLAIEDFGLQAAAFASPPKWHLAHTTWFFETFILQPFGRHYQQVNAQYEVLFNSYYNGVGVQYPRPQRGLLSRPTVEEVFAYRDHVNNAMVDLLADTTHPERASIAARCRLGIEHEKQHQELLITDIKYSLSMNPLYPAYQSQSIENQADSDAMVWHGVDGGLVSMGVNAEDMADLQNPFAFDNESPQHQVYVAPFAIASRLVTNGEYQAFIDDGGYQRSALWLADGWAAIQTHGWDKPLYWIDHDGEGHAFTTAGVQRRHPDAAVCHLSAYEAHAYATWVGARLPTEAEWELAAQTMPHTLVQLYDTCWQWTSSAYGPYPGFHTADGAIGEYNGKFMCNQWVLRGGSVATSPNHTRPSYRNFFYPHERWQFSGLRLAKYQ